MAKKFLLLIVLFAGAGFFNSSMAQDTESPPDSTKYSTETIEINRAVDRETPVSFSNVSQEQIESRTYSQDAPLLVRNVPGFYSYSSDGVGNGEAKLYIRGFTQEYVQVLINGIPTNDPESNAVYWSNWGSVSSNAGSFQIQRGAGSSLYGAGSFGGSFNIVTQLPSLTPFYGLEFAVGDPTSTRYGVKLGTGLLGGKFSSELNIQRKVANGSRTDGRYEGFNYYTSNAFFPTSNQVFKLVLHGAPQEHGYSWSQNIAYFKKYSYGANLAPFLPNTIVDQLPPNATTGDANYGLTDGVRELDGPTYTSLAHNFFHKPQLELSHAITLSNKAILNSTFFYSIGRGGGSSLNSSGTVFRLNRGVGSNGMTVDTLVVDKLGPDGFVDDLSVATNTYLANAFQRTSYSLHSQFGLLSSYTQQVSNKFQFTAGGEFRSWTADHPGYFTNMYGNTTRTFRYSRRDTSGNLGTFNRVVYQGDLDGPNDVGDPFSWNITDANGTYNNQYRNYRGETPQFTLFTQGNLQFNKVNFMGSLQYVWYKYKITERMPSENAIGQQLTQSQVSSLGITQEGAIGDNFYMKDNSGNYYEFPLVNAERSRGFLQPKLGVNYNINKNWNTFASFAHVERFVNLSVYYNYGRINPDAEDEKSNQFEAGVGFGNENAALKLNGYYMIWDNKSTTITDPSKAGDPGYDRNGNRTELIGSSINKGIEFEMNVSLAKLTKIPGLGVRGSFTYMDNVWSDILSSVETNPDGTRRAFNTGALDQNGNVDTLYFDELDGTPVASGPQLISTLSLTYNHKSFFGNIDLSNYSRNILLDGGTYMAVDGEFVGTNAAGQQLFQSEYSDQLPSATILDADVGYNFNFNKYLKGSITFQVLNIFDSEWLSSSDNFGVIPGLGRTFRGNLTIGL
ncbi:MAG: TonB-dependent receptor [Ignavibacteriae bacterium]|nr:TonB-dependent receptor [Ignavibacteriota bacterium]